MAFNDEGYGLGDMSFKTKPEGEGEGAAQAAAGTPTPNTPAAAAEPGAQAPATPEAEINDELALGYLKSKGLEVESLEDIFKKKDPEVIEREKEITDPYVKQLLEWREKTGRPIEDFAKYNKDYSKVDDLDVIRENLKNELPGITKGELDIKMQEYVSEEFDDESEIAKKSLNKRMAAKTARENLSKLSLSFGDPVPESNYPAEVRQRLDQYSEVSGKLEESKAKAEARINGLKERAKDLQQIEFKVGEQDLKFEIPQEQRNDMHSYATEPPHWRNADGTFNHEAAVRDAALIRNFDSILKVAVEQARASTVEQTVRNASGAPVDTGAKPGQEAPTSNPSLEGIKANFLGTSGLKSY